MRYVQMIFSPTGGTAKAAAAVTDCWHETETIDLTEINDRADAFSGDDLVLVAMPAFGGLAPQAPLDRMKNIQGNGAKCVLMAVYGNRAIEDTLVQMQDAVEALGFRVIAAISAVAQHSLVPLFAAGRPDKADIEQLRSFSRRITEKVRSNDMTAPVIPGNRPYRAPGRVMAPLTSDACTACGLCAEKCPLVAIDAENPKSTDGSKCIGCVRCVSICPVGARAFDRQRIDGITEMLSKVCSERRENELFI